MLIRFFFTVSDVIGCGGESQTMRFMLGVQRLHRGVYRGGAQRVAAGAEGL